MDISTITIMRGEYELIPKLLKNLDFAREIHIVETDKEPLKRFFDNQKVIIHHYPLEIGEAFDYARQIALKKIKSKWILIVDTDEMISKELSLYLKKSIDKFEKDKIEGIWIPRLNHVLGQKLKHTSSWPDYQLRLIQAKKAEFNNQIHNFVNTSISQKWLPAEEDLAIKHYNFESIDAFIKKLNVYSSIEAKNKKARKNSLLPLVVGFKEFLVRFIKMKGFLDGPYGLHYSILLGFYKYLIKLKEWEKIKK